MSYPLRITAEHVAIMEPERFAVDDIFSEYGTTRPITCAFCGSRNHSGAACPKRSKVGAA